MLDVWNIGLSFSKICYPLIKEVIEPLGNNGWSVPVPTGYLNLKFNVVFNKSKN